MATGRVLHVLAQRPGLTGSGITLDALVRHAGPAGWEQMAVVGVPADEPTPEVGCLPASRVRPLRFGAGRLPFPVPGMSDLMPYRSTRYSAMTPAQLATYRAAWREHLAAVLAEFEPDIIHSHHLWLVTGLLTGLAPTTPIVAHCHATGLRQLELCPHLTSEVRSGCSRANRFLVLHSADADLPRFVDDLALALERALGHPPRPGGRRGLPGGLDPFTWRAVFGRVEAVWSELLQE